MLTAFGHRSVRNAAMPFTPDYRHLAAVMRNERPARLPLYEHLVNPESMERVLNTGFAELGRSNKPEDLDEFFRHYCRFFREMTYDTVSFEVCIGGVLPDGGAIRGGKAGPIQNRADYERYPFDELPEAFARHAWPRFDALRRAMPEGMKAVGGVGNGPFEISENLVGLEYLPLMQVDDPELYRDLFDRIGRLMETVWSQFLERYADLFVACRFGDDLGFKSSLLTNPTTVRERLVPQYRRVIEKVHAAGKPFLWHSCGNIFEVMEDFIALGIDVKHSNEDAIAPFDEWLDKYKDRIAIVGGFDMHFLCTASEQEVYERVFEEGKRFRAKANGYALGSGNSIPKYVPLENYLAMVRAARAIREGEGAA